MKCGTIKQLLQQFLYGSANSDAGIVPACQSICWWPEA